MQFSFLLTALSSKLNTPGLNASLPSLLVVLFKVTRSFSVYCLYPVFFVSNLGLRQQIVGLILRSSLLILPRHCQEDQDTHTFQMSFF